MKRLLDSCILIDHFNAIPQATAYLKSQPNECAISKLVTRNTKDFDLNQHPFIEIPYTL